MKNLKSLPGFLLLVTVLLTVTESFSQEIKKIKAVELEKYILESKKPLIVNFWATWCQPCIEEIPYFLKEVKENKEDSVELILVSLDFKEAFPGDIAATVKKREFKASIAWLDETNADYFCPKIDSSWSGAIPASLFINNKTGYRKFYEEQLSHESLKVEMQALIRQ